MDAHTHRWLEKTQGLVEVSEGERLASLAATIPAGLGIVELGSHTGLSTCWLAAGSHDGHRAQVYAVDPWPEPRPGSLDDPWNLGAEGVLDRFRSNISGTTQWEPNTSYWDVVTPLRATSTLVARQWVKPVGLLFVDAIHEGWAVRQDWKAWSPHLADGAVVCFHDYGATYPGVRQAIEEAVIPSRSWSWIEFTEPSLWQGRVA